MLAGGCRRPKTIESKQKDDAVTVTQEKTGTTLQSPGQPLGIYDPEQSIWRGPEGGDGKSLNFTVNSADLDLTKARPALNDMHRKMTVPERKDHTFLVAGHADQTGSDEHNDKLSQDRADAVRDALLNHYGVAADRLIAKGYGKRYPKDKFALEKNRRVELWDLTENPEPYSTQETLVVDVSFLYRDPNGKAQTLSEGMTLRSGDFYQISFRPHQSCYVYVIQKDAKQTYRLFPQPDTGGETPVNAGRDYSVKLGGSDWLKLDNTVGQETIYLAASKQPIQDVEKALLAGPTRGPLNQGEQKSDSIKAAGIGFYTKITFNHK